MYISGTGAYMFENIYDMNYELFNEMGLGLRNQCLYDQDTGNLIQIDGKNIKASIDGTPVYAGRNDVPFEPQTNYHLVTCLFGLYLDKCTRVEDEDEEPVIKGFIAQCIDDDEAKEKQRVIVKTAAGDIVSNFYYQVYLAFFDCVFRIGGYNVDLSNFDFKPVKEKK